MRTATPTLVAGADKIVNEAAADVRTWQILLR
jgi:hypothetical protein